MAQQTDKQKQQAKLLAEIMQDDEKDGLYEPTVSKMERVQTAVEWLFLMINNPNENQELANKLFEQAKQMEKEQIINDYIAGQCTVQNFGTYYQGEQYYNETYNK